jgi:hypothetical protein
LTCSNAPAYLNSRDVSPGFATCESRKLIYSNVARFAVPSVCSPFASRSSFAGGVFLPDCGILVVVPCMLWCSSLPQQFSAADHLSLSGQVEMHPGLRVAVTMVHFAEGKQVGFSIFLKKKFACIRFSVFMHSNVLAR